MLMQNMNKRDLFEVLGVDVGILKCNLNGYLK
jgi:hypothetical protein